jgi:hypothetical protein
LQLFSSLKTASTRSLPQIFLPALLGYLIQNATDTGGGSLVFFLFDLLHLDVENLTALPLVERKTRLESLLHGAAIAPIQ